MNASPAPCPGTNLSCEIRILPGYGILLARPVSPEHLLAYVNRTWGYAKMMVKGRQCNNYVLQVYTVDPVGTFARLVPFVICTNGYRSICQVTDKLSYGAIYDKAAIVPILCLYIEYQGTLQTRK